MSQKNKTTVILLLIFIVGITTGLFVRDLVSFLFWIIPISFNIYSN